MEARYSLRVKSQFYRDFFTVVKNLGAYEYLCNILLVFKTNLLIPA